MHLDLRTLTFRFVFDPPGPPKSAEALKSYAGNGSGTVNGLPDPEKAVQIEYWQHVANEGFTDQAVRASALRFRTELDALQRRLAEHSFISGNWSASLISRGSSTLTGSRWPAIRLRDCTRASAPGSEASCTARVRQRGRYAAGL